MKINGNLQFHTLGTGELQNAIIERLTTTARTVAAHSAGRIVFDTDLGQYFYSTGTTWVAFATGGDATALQAEVDATQASLGAGVNPSGTFNQAGFTNVPTILVNPTSFTNAINQLATAVNSNNELSELDDVSLTGLTAGHVLYYNGTLWVNSAPGATSGVQPFDAGLANLAAFNTNGFVVQTADNVFAGRSFVAPTTGFTITNSDGVGGNPTFALANGLASIESLATTGIVVQSAADTFITRALATGSAARIVVTNEDGVAGSPTVDLALVADGGTGTFLKFTRDSYGRVSGTTAVTTADVTGLVDSVYVNVGGDTMTGQLNMGSHRITAVGTPTDDTDATTKAYVDALTAGLSWKQAVRVSTTANVDLATGGLLTIDGVTLVAGDRILVKNQTTASQNGIYVVATGAWTRATDANAGDELDGAALFVREGTAHGDTAWVQVTSPVMLGTTAIDFSQFSGSALYAWGTGLTLAGNTVNVNLGAGIYELPTDEVGIDLFSPSAGAIILTTDGLTRSAVNTAQLHLLLTPGPTGGLAQNASGLHIPAAAVTNAMLQHHTVTIDPDGPGTISVALGGTLPLLGDAAQGVSTSVSGSNVVITVGNATTTLKGVASFNADHFSVAAGAVSLAATIGDLTNVASTADSPTANDLLTFTAGEWQPVTRAAVVASTNLSDLADVADAAVPTDGHALVGNGTSWINQKIYHVYTGSSATTHSVAHGIGQQYCNVSVIETSVNELIIPQSVTFNDANNLTVTLNSPVAITVVVMGVA